MIGLGNSEERPSVDAMGTGVSEWGLQGKAGLETAVRGLDLKGILGKGLISRGTNRMGMLWIGLCPFSSVWPYCGGKQRVVLLEDSSEGGHASGVCGPAINNLQAALTNTEKIL